MPIKAGTVADFTGSMAAAMENALAQEYQNNKSQSLPSMGEEDRRMLFAAIAQGVVRHLKDHVDAFDISVTVGASTGTGEVDELQTSGTLY